MTDTETCRSPAADLRQAAERLRKDAAAATPGPWKHMCLGSEGCVVHRTSGTLRERGTRGTVARFGWKEWKADHADAVFVAGMNPVFALAVADWLEAEAIRAEQSGLALHSLSPGALATARAYLGETGE
jgi:hypothetical protein